MVKICIKKFLGDSARASDASRFAHRDKVRIPAVDRNMVLRIQGNSRTARTGNLTLSSPLCKSRPIRINDDRQNNDPSGDHLPHKVADTHED